MKKAPDSNRKNSNFYHSCELNTEKISQICDATFMVNCKN